MVDVTRGTGTKGSMGTECTVVGTGGFLTFLCTIKGSMGSECTVVGIGGFLTFLLTTKCSATWTGCTVVGGGGATGAETFLFIIKGSTGSECTVVGSGGGGFLTFLSNTKGSTCKDCTVVVVVGAGGFLIFLFATTKGSTGGGTGCTLGEDGAVTFFTLLFTIKGLVGVAGVACWLKTVVSLFNPLPTTGGPACEFFATSGGSCGGGGGCRFGGGPICGGC